MDSNSKPNAATEGKYLARISSTGDSSNNKEDSSNSKENSPNNNEDSTNNKEDSSSTNQAENNTDLRVELKKLLEASAEKHFVFFFGSPASGKTAALGSILHSLHQPDSMGSVFVHGTGDGFFAPGLALWSRIQSSFQDRRFPPRTSIGTSIQLHAEFRPKSSAPNLDLVFLEIAGEDFKSVNISESGGRNLPFHINQFLRIPSLKMVFILITSWEDAKKDDPMMDSFISYVNEAAPHLIENRFLLLVTKWDRKRKMKDESIDDFVRREMPGTYNKMSNNRNIIQPFSVGSVIPFSPDGKPHPDDIIDQFDFAASQRLFDRIYQTFHGFGLLRQPSLWDKFLSKLRG